MGQDLPGGEWSNEARQRYREKVGQNLDVLAHMLADSSFDPRDDTTGMEMELYLVDESGRPHYCNQAVLADIDDPTFQTELAQFNIELNVAPRALTGRSAFDLEDDLLHLLARADLAARRHGARVLPIGILPTVMPEHFRREWMSKNIRYAALNEAIMRARGENIFLDIHGSSGERITTYADSIGTEAACTSTQLHIQVQPHRFAAYWNASCVVAGAQIALGANSPFFYGKRLWVETRIPLFEQSADTRPVEMRNQGVRPRVCFGERWITSIFDLFEENVRYYPALLPEMTDEDPVAVLESGSPPELGELKLHNGTVYRWNRPVYDTHGGTPHLRVENRVLPAGPTVVDTVANALFYFGAVEALAAADRPVWTRMSFSAAEDNFRRGAKDGLAARLYWPSNPTISADELILRHLLPLADSGLADLGVDEEVRDHYLGLLETRCVTGQNGAAWQIATVAAHEACGLDRHEALRAMQSAYLLHCEGGAPVHTWPVPSTPMVVGDGDDGAPVGAWRSRRPRQSSASGHRGGMPGSGPSARTAD